MLSCHKTYSQFRDVYFVMDLMPADLRDFLRLGEQLPVPHIQFLMYQMMMGVSYMHSADIIHRDIKPENILVDEKCGVKLCDFGMARGIDFKNNPHMSSTYVQTRWYRAPELLLEYDKVSKAIDIWSCGCVFAELLKVGVLFPGRNPSDQVELITRLLGTPTDLSTVKGSRHGIEFIGKLKQRPKRQLSDVFPHADDLAIDLLEKMLRWDPDNRITASEAMRHPFFASIFSEEDMFQVSDLFDFTYEDKLTDIESIKEEAFITITKYNRILIRRRSSVANANLIDYKLNPIDSVNVNKLLIRRFSTDQTSVPKEHQNILKKFVNMFSKKDKRSGAPTPEKGTDNSSEPVGK
ncbi:mitogen-activated protein kinase [Acrasis kona]|uniref:Mitogen-activated protein kinase n=1 Tax=Acrasis kona TaxID=1008807 RepID=A0AAW2YNM0_9EUKA